jgi:microcompartment protein CcmK/EutM
MKINTIKLGAIALASLLSVGGCVSQPPTIAHTHVGHAMTGWTDTPNKQGLFVTAENAAQDALQAAVSAANKNNNLAGIKADVKRVIDATNSDNNQYAGDSAGAGAHYGVYNALNGAVNHITFAANSPDVSDNIRSSSKSFSSNAQVVLDRCDLILALGSEIDDASSTSEARLLTGELLKLTDANVNGEDLDGDGIVGSIPAEYGLKQLRTQLQAMIDREIPPYRTVDTWHLFNLVRMPNGDWVFREDVGTADDSGYSY